MPNNVKTLPTPQELCKMIDQADRLGVDVAYVEVDLSEFKNEKYKKLVENFKNLITFYVKNNTKWITLFVNVGKGDEHKYHLYVLRDECFRSPITSLYENYYYKEDIETFIILQSKLLGYGCNFIQSQIKMFEKNEDDL